MKKFTHCVKAAAILLLSCFVGQVTLFGQATTPAPAAAPAPKPVDHSYKPLTLKLNEDGSKYVRLIMWHQMWATMTKNNPGSLDVDGNDIGGKWTGDVCY